MKLSSYSLGLFFIATAVACSSGTDLPVATTGDGDAAGDGDGDTANPGDGDAVAGDGDGTPGDGDAVAGTGGTPGDGDGDVVTPGDGDGDGTGGTTSVPVDPAGESCALGTNYNIGEMRILNNQWTETQEDQCIFLNEDRSFGWEWDMNTTSMNPNYPEVEFGINPWGRQQDPWEVLPSSTTLLPIQLKDLTSASMTIDVTSTTNNSHWNLAFETWLSPIDPTTGQTAPEAELMVFFGNDPGYWPTTPEGGDVSGYTLYHSDDNWADGYMYRQYRNGDTDGTAEFNGSLDIKAFLDVSGFNGEWWITRFEIGNEVYDGSSGSTTIRSLCFEVNGESRCAQ